MTRSTSRRHSSSAFPMHQLIRGDVGIAGKAKPAAACGQRHMMHSRAGMHRPFVYTALRMIGADTVASLRANLRPETSKRREGRGVRRLGRWQVDPSRLFSKWLAYQRPPYGPLWVGAGMGLPDRVLGVS
jgi:hypothetical protein